MTRKELKLLIELSQNFEEADGLIEMHGDFRSTKEKIDFVKESFEVEIFDHPEDTPEEDAYRMLLTAALESKWEK